MSDFHRDEYVFIETELKNSNSSSLFCNLDDNKENVTCDYSGYINYLTDEEKSQSTIMEIALCGFDDYSCEKPEDTLTISIGYDFFHNPIATYTANHSFPHRNYNNNSVIYSSYYDAIFGTSDGGFSFYYGNIDTGQHIDLTQAFQNSKRLLDVSGNSIIGFALDPTDESQILVIVERGIFIVKPDLENPENSQFQFIGLKKDLLSEGIISSYSVAGNIIYASTGSVYQSRNEIHAIDLIEKKDMSFIRFDMYATLATVENKAYAKIATSRNDEFNVYSYSLPDYSSSLPHIKKLNSITTNDEKESCEILNAIDSTIFSKCGERFEVNSQLNALIKLPNIPMPEWADSDSHQQRVNLISNATNTDKTKLYFALTNTNGGDNQGMYIKVYDQTTKTFEEYDLDYDVPAIRFKSIFVRNNGELWAVMDEVNSGSMTGVGKITLGK